MYTPRHFDEPDVLRMHDLIRSHPLATLVTSTSGGIEANHIPLLVFPEPAPFGTLRGHVARANAVWTDFDPDVDVLAVFHGPNAYITPSWYATKQQTGKVVPTWNYAVVHAYGRLRAVDDPAWLRGLLDRLTAHNEASFATRWQVGDAPADYLERQLGAIVGIEIAITRLRGKWKVSQNQPKQNQESVIAGLNATGTGTADAMAALVAAGAQVARRPQP